MTEFRTNITKRIRKRGLSDGSSVEHVRYVLSYRDPETGQRVQRFFERHKDALAARDEVAQALREGTYRDPRQTPTVREAVEHWLKDRESQVKPMCLRYYRLIGAYICGPLLLASAKERSDYVTKGVLPPHAKFRRLLGDIKVTELSTAEIRTWNKLLLDEVGFYTAKKAKAALATVLALAAEDFKLRAPTMPRQIGRGRPRPKKALLTLEQVGQLLEMAQQDRDWGLYYAWPFLTGTRPSEQLGMLWSAVDFERNVVRICRMQEMNGSLTEVTKTEAGLREVPMCALLRRMLLEWRLRCPRLAGELHRVFPGHGRLARWPSAVRPCAGGPLYYAHFRERIWHPALKRLGLPAVTPHSARHLFISALQAQGVEVGLVSKLAGHASARVTLTHYTQAIRGGEEAMERLAGAYGSCN